MNTDHPYSNHAGHKVWSLIKDGAVYVFRQYYEGGKIEICEPDGEVLKLTAEHARVVWETLISYGFVVQNACHHWGMDEFNKMKREEEMKSVYQLGNRKDRRKKEWFDKVLKNYALEA
tara:strand:+ start:25267 stop:25620 length:354 start_codon:yes stop_codon:yes gene_type:complete